MKVFLSSTIYDLKDLRSVLVNELSLAGFTVLSSDHGTIPTDSSKHSYDLCIAAARDCDCLVAVIDSRFGGAMPDGTTSISQAEINAALDNGKQVYVFIRQSVWDAKEIYKQYLDAGYPFKPTKLISDHRVLEVIDSLRRRKQGNWIFLFNVPHDIVRQLRCQLGIGGTDAAINLTQGESTNLQVNQDVQPHLLPDMLEKDLRREIEHLVRKYARNSGPRRVDDALNPPHDIVN